MDEDARCSEWAKLTRTSSQLSNTDILEFRPTYRYSAISLGCDIRLLQLMPHEDVTAPIECRLFDYALHDSRKGTHLYEALSYVWGSSSKPRSISIDNHSLPVTGNLLAALSRLRDRFLERIIWVDAICINQADLKEQGSQVQRMAKIYSKASRVIVWLGETALDSDRAFEELGVAADINPARFSTSEAIQQAILALLQRPWFQRIWVLQEVAAARHIVMMCGFMEIDGFAFCSGLKSLNLSYTASPELQSVPSITYLIERAGLRSKHTTNSRTRFSLDIRSLPELIDMFHTRKASNVRDKVYALLSMSSDNPGEAGLRPDYEISWKELYQQLIKFTLGKCVSVETNDSQRAVIQSKGCILGQVSSISDDRQHVNIVSKNKAWCSGEEIEWSLQPSAKFIRERDIVCLLQGASKPTIIRLCKDRIAIIVIAATPLDEGGSFEQLELFKSVAHFPRDFLLVWDLEDSVGRLQVQKGNSDLTKTNRQTEFGTQSDMATREWNVALILGDLGEYEEAEASLQKAIEMVVGNEYSSTLENQYGLTPLAWAAGNGYETVVTLLLAKNGTDPDLKDSQYGRTPLSWAAAGGHETVVKLLLDTSKVNVNSKDDSGWTPLLRASAQGHDAVVKLLLAKNGADPDLKDSQYGRTPLSWAAAGGHETVVKLLLDTSKVNVNSKDDSGWTPLLRASAQGHEGVLKLLLGEDDTDLHLKDSQYGRTPLSWATAGGHETVVKLLLDTSKASVDIGDKYGRTPLSWATAEGHEAVVKLLLEACDVNVDSKDDSGRTPFFWAAEKGHEAVVKLLLETGKVDINSKDMHGRTPLSGASINGQDAVVKLLHKTCKIQVEINSKDNHGRTPLSLAAAGGCVDVVKLLLKMGMSEVEIDFKDMWGRTPLSWAAKEGNEAVVKLLLETGRVNVNSKDKIGQTPLLWASVEGHEGVVRLLWDTGKVDVDSNDG